MHPTNSRAHSPSTPRPTASLVAALTVGAALLSAFGGTANAQCSTSFVQPVTGYTAPFGSVGAYRIISRDLNGDGRADLVTINPNNGRTAVRLATGNGTFGPDTAFNAGSVPVGLAMSDINGDGRPDIVVHNFSGPSMETVLLANPAGDGTFAPPIHNNVSGSFGHMAAADFNGDGRGDIVLANSALQVKIGNGDGTFGPNTTFTPSPTNPAVSWIVAGDFNGDTKPDIACALNANNTVAVLLNNGTTGGVASFAAAVNYPVGPNPQGLAVGDVNSDGRPDLISANRNGNSVTVLLCNANGTFANAPGGGSYLAGSAANHVVIGDFNGDNSVDLAVTGFNTTTVTVLRGNGDGSFGNNAPFTVPVTEAMAVGDYTGDGKMDIVGSAAAMSGDHFWMLTNNSAGAPAPTFASQPVGQVVAAGGTANLSANVSNAQSYQWRRNGVPFSDGDLIWGAATNTLTITQASAADMAVYDLRVSSVSCNGLVTTAFSNPVVLAVTPSTAPVAPANDNCAAAPLITNGTHTFNTANATTDGPSEANLGFCCSDNQIHKDVWFIYTATCTGVATFNMCASGFDTKIAIYNGANCPSGPNTAMAGNDDNGVCTPAGDRSHVSFNAIAGRHYRVRVGGYNGNSGDVSMTVSCDGSTCLRADLGVQGGGLGRDGALDNNDFIAFIEAFFSQTTCP